MTARLTRFSGLTLLCAIPLFVGCSSGEKQLKVRGKVHRGGSALTLTSKAPGGSQVEVGFHPMSGDSKDPKIVIADNTGNFDMSVGGKGVAAGKYKVSVHQYDPRPDDKLKNAFSKDKTPIIIEISGEDAIDIDLAKYEKK